MINQREQGYNGFSCDGCGSPIPFDVLLPDEVWNKVKREDYALCHYCIDDRLAELGIKIVAEGLFRGKALQLKISDAGEKIIKRFCPREYYKMET